MKLVVSRSALLAFWSAFQMPAPTPTAAGAALIMSRAASTGWTNLMHIENLLLSTDPRLWRLTTREVLKVFGIETQYVFKRPASTARDAEGEEEPIRWRKRRDGANHSP